jgi:diacylglycerol kinase family enzyme
VTSPFGPLVLIANPRAGRGKVDAALPQVERVLRDEGLDYRIVRTTHPGHATEAARDALRNGERYLVAAGGDGTVHEVVNGMIQNGRPLAPDAVLGVVAAGSGCDFVRTFALPGDADGHAFAWRAFNVVVANGRFYGAGMQISPKSDPGDGLLDVLVMTGPKSDAFATLPKVYRGTHLPHRNIAELRAGVIRLDSGRPFPVEADGEILGTTPVSFGIIPGVIRLKV